MLGRLRMSVDECISAYTRLAGAVFLEQKHTFGFTVTTKLQEKFDSEVLKRVIRELVRKQGFDEDELLKDTSIQPCKVYVEKACPTVVIFTNAGSASCVRRRKHYHLVQSSSEAIDRQESLWIYTIVPPFGRQREQRPQRRHILILSSLDLKINASLMEALARTTQFSSCGRKLLMCFLLTSRCATM